MNLIIETLKKVQGTGYVLDVNWTVEGLSHGQPVWFNGHTTLLPEDEEPNPEPGFIPFENLTEAEVKQWIMDREGAEITKTFDEMGAAAKKAQDDFFNGPTADEVVPAPPPWTPPGPQPEEEGAPA